MHVLWLCSWYPNPTDWYDGDFIARHAEALATITKVHVIHVVQNHTLLANATPGVYLRQRHHLTEELHILRYNRTRIGIIDRFLFNLNYYRSYRRILKAYMQQHGTPHLLHVHVPVKAAVAARWLLRTQGIPYVVTEHSSSYEMAIPQSYQQRNWFFRYQTRAAFRNAAAVSSVSHWLLLRLQQLFAIRHTRIIRNCVNTDVFYLPECKDQKQRFRFIHVSMLLPLKNVSGILQAFQQVLQVRTDWELVVVGPADATLQQQAAALGLVQHITWTGLLAYEAVAAQLQQADALVHFSDYENLPCVISEALCCGVPVISSNVGGIHEVIHPSNGLLVPPKDVAALRDAILQMLANHSLYNRPAIAAAAAKTFSYDTIGNEMLEWYQEVLQQLNP
jgi:glycosyltransferase involved in cell wall biosynthesis